MAEPELKLPVRLPPPGIKWESVSLERNKALALLAYLAVIRQTHSRKLLTTLLWPDHDQSQAYAYLRRTLWSINNTLGEEWLNADRDSITMRSDTHFWLDIANWRAGHGQRGPSEGQGHRL